MKTLLIYNQIEGDLKFAMLNGDYTRFNGIVINGIEDNPYELEFCDYIYDEIGNFKIEMSDDTSLLKSKEWDDVAIVTWLP